MTGKRRLRAFLALSVAVVLAGAAATVYLLLRPVPEVTLTAMSRLAPGMTEAEVAARLGPPTADLTAAPPPRAPAPAPGGRLLEYAGPRATVWVELGPDGRLARCRLAAVRSVSGVERVRLRLGWGPRLDWASW